MERMQRQQSILGGRCLCSFHQGFVQMEVDLYTGYILWLEILCVKVHLVLFLSSCAHFCVWDKTTKELSQKGDNWLELVYVVTPSNLIPVKVNHNASYINLKTEKEAASGECPNNIGGGR